MHPAGRRVRPKRVASLTARSTKTCVRRWRRERDEKNRLGDARLERRECERVRSRDATTTVGVGSWQRAPGFLKTDETEERTKERERERESSIGPLPGKGSEQHVGKKGKQRETSSVKSPP